MSAALVGYGCGGSGGPCADVDCEFGVCAPESGQCVNPDSCEVPERPSAPPVDTGGDAGMADATSSDAGSNSSNRLTREERRSNCLRGYSCVAGVCQADEPCGSDNPCDRGTCQKGACVNKDSCESDSDCASGYSCNTSENTCEIDRCDGKTCDRGVCDPETGSCVDAEQCPFPDKSRPACQEGHRCYEPDSTCLDEESYCERLDCTRGICNFEQDACVNAETCSEDADCTEGYYCGEDGSCQRNTCDERNVICDRGICDEVEGECVNPDACSASEECLPMNVCVDNSCVPRSEMCGESGCPGNQECTYDAESLSASCQENDAGCLDAVDCKSDRVCLQGTCESPPECESDSLEPNDSESEATSYFDAREDGQVGGSICQDDADVFTFDTSKDDNFRGRFVVNLDFARNDVGIGDVEVEVLDPNGETYAKAESNEEGRVRIDEFFGASDGGVYKIVVRDTGNVGVSGVDYELLADIVSRTVQRACTNAGAIEGGSAEGNSLSGASVELTASCILQSERLSEEIFSFELEESRYVKIDVSPESPEVDVGISVQKQCGIPSTEVACRNRQGTDGTESIRRALEPGKYFLIVQSAASDAGGAFSVNFATDPASCTPADDRCISENQARVCTSGGESLEERDCSRGCNEQLGECQRAEGDVCRNAIDATGGFSNGTVNWDELTNSFDPGSDSCLSNLAPASDGPDSIYRVDLEPNHGLRAELDMSGGTDGSLYILERCNSDGSFCDIGADSNNSTETLGYQNETSDSETVFVVADAEQGASGTADIEIDTGEVVCEPGRASCDSGNVVTCNSGGIGFEEQQSCSFGCSSGECAADTCESAIPVTGSNSWSVDTSKFAQNYDLGRNNCLGDSTTGADLVYEVTVPSEGWVTASVTDETGDDTDPGIYAARDCRSAATQLSSCVTGQNEKDDGTETISFQNDTDSQQTYSIIVAETDFFSQSANWTVDIDVQPKTCEPGETSCSNSSTLEYCGPRGLQYETYTCQGSSGQCNDQNGSAQCDDPQGDLCVDAIPVSDGESKSGDFQGSDDSNVSTGYPGECSVTASSGGPDTIYRVDLQEDDLLTASLQTDKSDARLYVLGACYEGETCRGFQEGEGVVHHFAEQAETAYVVVDSASSGSESFTVDFQVASNRVCEPNETRCSSGNTVGFCNSAGTGYDDEYGCVSGTCQDGSCDVDTSLADQCSNAPSIANGTVIVENFDDFSDQKEVSSCTGRDTDGPDAFFSVDVPSGEILRANVDARGDADPALYLFEDCNSPGNTCLAGDSAGFGGDSSSIFYKASQNRTLLLAVDSDDGSGGIFEMEVRTQSPACQPDSRVCGTGQNTLKFCEHPGFWTDYTCSGGCSSGSCNNPIGDTCADRFEVTSFPATKNPDMDTFSNSFEVSDNSCTGESSSGNDVVYEVNAQDGETISVDVTPDDSDDDPIVVLTRECSRLAKEGDPACTAGVDDGSGGDTENLSHTVRSGQGGSYYVIVDADSTFDDEEPFTVDIDVTSNP